MHKLLRLIKLVNKTHKHLGAMVGMNIVAAKAKRCILNIAPAGTGKSTATDTNAYILKDRCIRYTSLTLSGMAKIRDELQDYNGHIIIDDLGAEKSEWSRTSTIASLAHIVMQHHIRKITQTTTVEITGFNGSAALNIQPVMMQSLVRDSDWIAVVRDKVIRYYHLYRPIKPKRSIPAVDFDWGTPIERVKEPKYKGKLWYQLITIGLTQWSYGRCLTHIPELLRAMAALDGREEVQTQDFRLLIKLMKPMQLERYIIESYGFEEGRTFNNNVVCILVELATWGTPSIDTIAEDYKLHPRTIERLCATAPEWCFLNPNSPKQLFPTEQTLDIFKTIGVKQRW